MSKVTHKKDTVTLTVSSNQVLATLDATNCNGVSIQVNPPVGASGTMKLQWSNDNTNWIDIASATATISSATPAIIVKENFYAGHCRALVTLSAGAGAYTYYALGKER